CGAPILAAVEGLAAGAGAALALAADVTLADARASFAFPGAQLGLTPDAGLSWLLTQAAGPARARALLMLGEPIPAEEAAAMGLIWRVAPDGFLAVEAQDVARRLAEGPTQAHLAVRRLVREAAAAGFDAQVEAEAEALDSAGRSRDWLEGAVAFVEGRAPFFRGR
ncbi:MAG: enoyl-CoA hydratase-related protein, partial [Pseudomonadota bacterium]